MLKKTSSLGLTEEQKVAFFGLVFASAHSDNYMSNDEIMQIFGLMDLEEMSNETQNKIRSFILEKPDIDRCFAVLRDSSDEIRHSLAINVMMVILADGKISAKEEAFLNDLYNRLGVKKEQRDAIETFVRVSMGGTDGKIDEGRLNKAIKGLDDAGISRTVLIACGAGFVAGIGIDLVQLKRLGKFLPYGTAIALFIGAVVIVTSMLFGSEEAKEKQRLAAEQRKSQLVIENLIETINALRARQNISVKDSQYKQEQIDELINRLKRMHEINKNKQTKDK